MIPIIFSRTEVVKGQKWNRVANVQLKERPTKQIEIKLNAQRIAAANPDGVLNF